MVEEYCTGTVRIYFYLFEHLQFTVTYSFYGLQIYSLRTVTVTVRVCTVYLFILLYCTRAPGYHCQKGATFFELRQPESESEKS